MATVITMSSGPCSRLSSAALRVILWKPHDGLTHLPLCCVYYSWANIEIHDMKAGDERDKGAYVLAAAFNSNITLSQHKRRFFEEEQLYSGVAHHLQNGM